MFSIIYLIGFRGSGKTTIGNLLSKKINYVFNDTDQLIEKYYKKNISEIVKQYGWKYFRKIESDILKNITEPYKVIATGGGIVLNKKNCLFMKTNGKIFYLYTRYKFLKNRLLNDLKKEQRPSLIYHTKYSISQEIKVILPKRMKIYKKITDFTIDNNVNDPKKTIKSILKFL